MASSWLGYESDSGSQYHAVRESPSARMVLPDAEVFDVIISCVGVPQPASRKSDVKIMRMIFIMYVYKKYLFQKSAYKKI